ncbi:lipoprotein bor [Pectobacterium parmentieri]|uniref:Bor protein n=1 Tax=Pectobacterium parmentieri TaxID=1905730 RepID=A0A0H3I0Q3_PECPM|nr:Bor family protein [Pectobacterium parmentieri]AFI89642.1 Bor protein [Pectobacterium parmentieri]MBI0472066.1 lipoprotein bor [Pectobacterium parmentieri]MBI0495175.1 lipoprotein bor [Pectobacterium parmentieri]MBI0556227.1 lipoprotein bor [Pectobacterium parmentieri]MBI0569311.1 lipoprotein bor [Pectobacterium parmentieri]
MKKLPALALLALMMSGCAQQSFTVKNEATAAPNQTTTHHFFVSGIGQQKAIDAAAVCGGSDKVVRTEVQQTFVNGLLNVATFGIYTPREARIYCSL